MLDALQSEPNQAIVAARYYVIIDQVEWSGFGRLIIVTGYADILRPEFVLNQLKQQTTQWFFSWGRSGTDVDRIEAEEKRKANSIGGLQTVTIAIHEQGHFFPTSEIT